MVCQLLNKRIYGDDDGGDDDDDDDSLNKAFVVIHSDFSL